MKILFAAPEAAPFAKTGGLADVAGSLPPALAKLDHEVAVVMPRYRQVNIASLRLKRVASFFVPLGTWQERCDVLKGRMGRSVTVFFINKDAYFDRPELYGTPRADYPDNAERFIFFSRAVLELCRVLDFRPDIVHCNDWQTGLVPVYLRKIYYATPELRQAKSVFTVHNLGYQGLFWHWDMKLTGLGWDVFTPEGLEFWSKISLIKAGLVYADSITTVSRTYSREIQTPAYGAGLEGVLKKRAADLYGILNGIDYTEWNPSREGDLPWPYNAANPAGKALCKKAILEHLGLPDSGGPLIGMVTRLVDQKGLDIITEALPEILSLGTQLVILGTGDEKYNRLLTAEANRHADRMRVILQYNERLAKKIYAGCDLFLMPSRYEPCGLGQMIALRYGAAPVVRKTGGLADSVVDYDILTSRGTGFVFEEYSSTALIGCLRRALEAYGNRKRWMLLMKACMTQDFSWKKSAQEYVKAYQETMKK